ncbi:MAG: DNA/RNA nuclease SfsA [Clostridiales bacterium]|nr:DNA/RNA nuclease SfsA [Clostridiales bacterium]
MKYDNILKAKFISRPNRFIAHVELKGREVAVHVKNTGRCKELLVPDATVYLEDFTGRMGSRKMTYSLIAVEKVVERGKMLINMDSQAPNKVVREALENGTLVLPGMGHVAEIKAEAVYGNSRLDFFICDEKGKKGYIEVKGVTLENCGIAAFPDAPTERGVKHLRELSALAASGYEAYALFVIQMEGTQEFRTNDKTHKGFGDGLRAAAKSGVHVLAYECKVKPDSLEIWLPVKVVV